jgi:hypothetical protein
MAARAKNSEALLETIEVGIDDARNRRDDITEHRARAITPAIANTLGDNGRTLGEFTRTGSGSYAGLSDEFLDVHNDPTTRPPVLRFAPRPTGSAPTS